MQTLSIPFMSKQYSLATVKLRKGKKAMLLEVELGWIHLSKTLSTSGTGEV